MPLAPLASPLLGMIVMITLITWLQLLVVVMLRSIGLPKHTIELTVPLPLTPPHLRIAPFLRQVIGITT